MKKYIIATMRHTGSKDYAVCLWGPNRSGYTPNIEEAGIYSEEEVKDFVGRKDDFPIELDFALLMSVVREYNYNSWKKGKFILNDEVFYNTFNVNKKMLLNKGSDKQYFRYIKEN